MKNAVNADRIAVAINLFFISLCVCLLSCLSPISTYSPTCDPSVFILIGKGMSHGLAPYLNFFDHKGPLLYTIDCIGWVMGKTLGIWCIEVFLMTISVFFAYKTARFFGDQMASFTGVFFCFLSLSPFFGAGNLTEEYALPFIFLSLYLFTKYFFKEQAFKSWEILIIGACFGGTLLLRPNMFAVWAVFCVVLFIRMLVKREFASAVRFALLFIAGAVIIITPFMAYLYFSGAFSDFIYQYFIFNSLYAGSVGSVLAYAKHFIIIVTDSNTYLIIAGILFFAMKSKSLLRLYHFTYLFALCLTILMISVSNSYYAHYSMILIPLYIPLLVLVSSYLFQVFKNKRVAKSIAMVLLILCILFSNAIFQWLSYVAAYSRSDTGKQVSQIAEIIDTNTVSTDKITVVGNNCDIYLASNRDSVSKYIYQIPIVTYSNDIAEEYKQDVLSSKPKIIVIYNDIYKSISSGKCKQLVFLTSLFNTQYTKINTTKDYSVYKIKE